MSEPFVNVRGRMFSESELRAALTELQSIPAHDWKEGDVFRHGQNGNFFKILELRGRNGATVQQYAPMTPHFWNLPDSYMFRWVRQP